MLDLIRNPGSQPLALADVMHGKVDALTNRSASVAGLDLFQVQPRELHGRVADVEVPVDEELPFQVIGAPCDDAGPGELIAQVERQVDRHLGARFRHPEAHLQFFNPAFQVRPFLSRHDVGVPLHHGRAGEGRPYRARAA